MKKIFNLSPNYRSQISLSLMAILLFCLLPLPSMAQTWNWGIKGGSSTAGQTGKENIIDMATDQNGNVYFIASVKGPGATLGSSNIPLTYYGYDDILLASYDCEGNYRWHKSFGGWVDDKPVAIGVDTLGGVYATGMAYSPGDGPFNFDNPVSFDLDSTVAKGTRKSAFIIKYDTAGIFQWLRMAEPDTMSQGYINTGVWDMMVKPNGDLLCYIRSYGGLMSPGNIILPSGFGDFILKINGQGNLLNYTQFQMETSFHTDFKAKVAQDPNNGNYYIAGMYSKHSTGGYFTMGAHPIDSLNSMVVGAFNSQGQYLWHRTNTKNAVGFFGRPQIDNQGNITLLGFFSRSNVVGFVPDTFNGYIAELIPGFPSNSPFIVQLSPTGTNNWALGSFAKTDTKFKGITSLDNKFIVGGLSPASASVISKFFWEGSSDTIKHNENHFILHKINATTGVFTDTLTDLNIHVEAPAFNEISIITKDKNNNLYIGGAFNSQQFIFPNDTLKAEGPSDFFVARYGYDCNCDAPIASFSYAASGNNTVSFSYTGTTPYSSISWDFGDGNNSTSANPTHTYAAAGNFNVCVTATNDCGTNTYCQTVDAVEVGIGDNSLAAQIALYPNPTKGSLMIRGLQGTTRYQLHNSLGQTVRQGIFQGNQAELDLSNLAAGWFVLELQDEQGGKGRFKVIKN